MYEVEFALKKIMHAQEQLRCVAGGITPPSVYIVPHALGYPKVAVNRSQRQRALREKKKIESRRSARPQVNALRVVRLLQSMQDHYFPVQAW